MSTLFETRYLRQVAALVICMGISAAAAASGEEILLPRRLSPPVEHDGLPDGWKPLRFKNVAATTQYIVGPDGDGFVLKAESRNAASGLYRPVNLDPEAYPMLVWRWKVENILGKGDKRRKEGDDYAARTYVVFQYDPDTVTLWEKTRHGTYKLLYGEYPPKVLINSIRANRLAIEAAVDNAFTDRAKIIAVRSGPQEIHWRLG